MSRRTSGSPPVMRSLRTPLPTKTRAEPVELLERQQILLGQERHVLRHAIDAAEIAAVRDRDPQIGDRAAERVDERPFGRTTGDNAVDDRSTLDISDLGFLPGSSPWTEMPEIRHDDLATPSSPLYMVSRLVVRGCGPKRSEN